MQFSFKLRPTANFVIYSPDKNASFAKKFSYTNYESHGLMSETFAELEENDENGSFWLKMQWPLRKCCVSTAKYFFASW